MRLYGYSVLLGAALLGACSTTSKVAENKNSERKVANDPIGLDQNRREILERIPLFKGYEKYDKINPSDSKKEKEITNELIEIFSKIQAEAAEPKADKKLGRGTHHKGICFNAKFKIFNEEELKEKNQNLATKNKVNLNELVEKLRQGIFENPGEYEAQLRFANAKGEYLSDSKGDVRGLAFSVDMNGKMIDPTGRSRQDFMMNSSPMFLVDNIQDFLQMMRADELKRDISNHRLSRFKNTSAILKAPLVIEKAKLLGSFEKEDTTYTQKDYWANLPYSHGLDGENPKYIVKYKATPCGEYKLKQYSNSSENKLQENAVNQLKEKGICYNLQVQFFNYNALKLADKRHSLWGEPSDMIEDGGALWDEKILPFYNVAQIKANIEDNPNPSVDSQQSLCDDRYINTRLHSARTNQPMGSIARVRTIIEEDSRYNRMNQSNKSY